MIEYYHWNDVFVIWRLNIVGTRGDNNKSSRDTIKDSLAGMKFASEQTSIRQTKIITLTVLFKFVCYHYLQNALHYNTNRFLLFRKIQICLKDLLQCGVNVYYGIQIPLSNMYSEQLTQDIRCMKEKSWYGQPVYHNRVWVKVSNQYEDQEAAYGAFQGCLLYHLLKLFKLSAEGGAFQYVFVQTVTSAVGSTPERASSMVKVIKPTTGSGYAVISSDRIGDAAHLILEEPHFSRINNKGWLVNSHIDLATWNEVY